MNQESCSHTIIQPDDARRTAQNPTAAQMMQKHGFLMQYLLELALVDSQMWRLSTGLIG